MTKLAYIMMLEFLSTLEFLRKKKKSLFFKHKNNSVINFVKVFFYQKI